MRSSLLRTHRWDNRNHYFQFHPMHPLFSLLAALVLLGLMALFMVTEAH